MLVHLVLIGLLVPSLVWACCDRHVWPWDQAWYAETAINLSLICRRHWDQWLAAMLHAMPTKPPAIAWFGQLFVPLGAAVHHIEPALLCSILLSQFGTLYFIYLISKELFPESCMFPLTGSLCSASMPLFVAMSHQFLVEALQTFAVSYFYWIALKSWQWSISKIASHLLLAGVIAMLAKFSTPLFCFAPVIMTLIVVTRQLSSRRRRLFRLDRSDVLRLVCGLFLGLMTSTWYAINFSTVWQQAREATIGNQALNYGHRDTFFQKFAYWLPSLFSNFGLPEFWCCLAVLASWGLLRLIKQSGWNHSHSAGFPYRLLAIILILEIILVLSMFSLIIPEEPRYLLPLLPSIVILILLLFKIFDDLRIKQIMVVALFWQFCVVHAQAQGLILKDPRICPWLIPVCKDATKARLIDDIVKVTSTRAACEPITVCGVDLPWLNYNSLSFYAVKNSLETEKRAYYLPLGYGETEDQKVWLQIKNERASYFISCDPSLVSIPTDAFNFLDRPILKKVSNSKEWKRVVLQPSPAVLIFHRTKDNI